MATTPKEEIRLGDVVKLKTPGPRMTVVSVEATQAFPIMTQWFAGDTLNTGYFAPESLEKV